jgi:hypothetical protein
MPPLELHPNAVQMYIAWLYLGQLHFNNDIEQTSYEFNTSLYKTSIVADGLRDTEIKNAIINSMATEIVRLHSVATTKDVYETSNFGTYCVKKVIVGFTFVLAWNR